MNVTSPVAEGTSNHGTLDVQMVKYCYLVLLSLPGNNTAGRLCVYTVVFLFKTDTVFSVSVERTFT